jgi:hypothetical protein
VRILAAQTPDAPEIPTTVVNGADITIAWQEPDSNGSPITSYLIVIRSHTGDYFEDTEYCDGSDALILETR